MRSSAPYRGLTPIRPTGYYPSVVEDGLSPRVMCRRFSRARSRRSRMAACWSTTRWKTTGFELGGFVNLKSWLGGRRWDSQPNQGAQPNSPPRGHHAGGCAGMRQIPWQRKPLRANGNAAARGCGPVIDKFIGESGENFRKAIEMAESLVPIVLWIDEIEKRWRRGGGSGEASDAGLELTPLWRVLTWLQERSTTSSSYPLLPFPPRTTSALPPELLRKGSTRFFRRPAGHRRTHRHLGRSISAFVNRTTLGSIFRNRRRQRTGFSGSEIEQAVVAALYRALHRKQPLTTDLLEEISTRCRCPVTGVKISTSWRAMAQGRFVNVR